MLEVICPPIQGAFLSGSSLRKWTAGILSVSVDKLTKMNTYISDSGELSNVAGNEPL